MVHVSVTGFRPKGWAVLPIFLWRTMRAFAQARRAAGNLATTGRLIDGVYHTMTVWSDRESMRAYVMSGAHRAAMKNFRKLGGGRTWGYDCAEIPSWDAAYADWQRFSREV